MGVAPYIKINRIYMTCIFFLLRAKYTPISINTAADAIIAHSERVGTEIKRI
jgi:hypothetical protein